MADAWGGASREHQEAVMSLIQDFRERGYEVIAAAYRDFPQPFPLGRHEPDVIARLGGHYLIGEAKTAEDLSSTRTAEQVFDYTGFKDATLVLSLPADCRGSKACSDILFWAVVGRAEVIYRPGTQLKALLDALGRASKRHRPLGPGAV